MYYVVVVVVDDDDDDDAIISISVYVCMVDKQEYVSLDNVENADRNLPLSLTVRKPFLYAVACSPVKTQ